MRPTASSSPDLSAYDPTNHLYAYIITNLTPGTKYFYRVVVGNQYAGGTFITAPDASACSVKFFSYGDTRSNGSTHNGLAGQVNAAFAADPAFQTLNLHVGDWVSGDSECAWTGEWFNPSYTNIRQQDANIADIGVRGNHESGATYWKRYWPEPFQTGGLYWSFDYGPLHVVLLDQYTSYTPGSAQYNWLKADLAASTKTWKVVVLHEPGWSAGGGHANNTSRPAEPAAALHPVRGLAGLRRPQPLLCPRQRERRHPPHHGRRGSASATARLPVSPTSSRPTRATALGEFSHLWQHPHGPDHQQLRRGGGFLHHHPLGKHSKRYHSGGRSNRPPDNCVKR